MKPLLTTAFAALLSSSSFATTLAINLGPTSQDAEAGFDLAPSANQGANPEPNPQTISLGIFSGVTITATTSGTDARYRSVDRGDSTAYSGALDQLTEGWVGTQAQSSPLTLILDGIAGGAHTWTSYHFDNGTGSGGSGNQSGQMLIELSTDSGSSFSTVATDFQIQDNEGTATSALAPFTTTFTAVAGQSVQVRFTNTALGLTAGGAPDPAQDFTLINGFQVTPVPEPSSAALGALGLLALMRRRR